MKQLQLYTAPAAELFVIRFEQNIMSGGQYGTAGYAGSDLDEELGIDL